MPIIGPFVRRHIVVGVIAVAGGFSGGVLHDLTSAKPATIRAERFEVVESGHLLSYWGPDCDRNLPANSLKNTLLVFLDSRGVRRVQIGAGNGNSPHFLMYGENGPLDSPQRYNFQPNVSIGLGWTGSPIVRLRGSQGDGAILGASIGYSHWGGSYRSGISLSDEAGKHWEVKAGDELKPIPLIKPSL